MRNIFRDHKPQTSGIEAPRCAHVNLNLLISRPNMPIAFHTPLSFHDKHETCQFPMHSHYVDMMLEQITTTFNTDQLDIN